MAAWRRLTGLAALMALGACAGDRIVSQTVNGRGVPWAEVNALASSGRQVEVHGAPPDGAPPEAVAALLAVPGFRNEAPFRLIPAGSAGLRVVLEFGVAPGSNLSCTQPRGSALGGPMTLTATLCNGPSYISTATLRSDTLRGPSDPAFAGAMNRLMLALLPPEPAKVEFR
jgi:hypothetical protein